jgi:hypothetical protein
MLTGTARRYTLHRCLEVSLHHQLHPILPLLLQQQGAHRQKHPVLLLGTSPHHVADTHTLLVASMVLLHPLQQQQGQPPAGPALHPV